MKTIKDRLIFVIKIIILICVVVIFYFILCSFHYLIFSNIKIDNPEYDLADYGHIGILLTLLPILIWPYIGLAQLICWIITGKTIGYLGVGKWYENLWQKNCNYLYDKKYYEEDNQWWEDYKNALREINK